MNRLKNLVNNDQGKTLNTAEQRFARIQGLVVLFGETKIYCDQNEKLYSNIKMNGCQSAYATKIVTIWTVTGPKQLLNGCQAVKTRLR